MNKSTPRQLKAIRNIIREIEAEEKEKAKTQKAVTFETMSIPLGFKPTYSLILNGPATFTSNIDCIFGQHKPRAWGLFRRYLQHSVDAQRAAQIAQNPRILLAIRHIDSKLKRVGG